jgi:NAD-dependent DNA ligase
MFFFLISVRLKNVPGLGQNVAETLIAFMRDEVIGQIAKDLVSAWGDRHE